MANAALSADARQQLKQVLINPRLKPKFDRTAASRAIAALERCKATFLEWKVAEEDAVRSHGRSLFVRYGLSSQTRTGLHRIHKLASQLHRELTLSATGHAFLRGPG